MNITFIRTFSFILLFVNIVAIADVNSVNQQPLYSQVYDPKRNAFDDGRAALELAKKSNRRVMIEIGGDWCAYCHILDRFIKSNPEVEKQLYKTFVVLKVNYSDANRNKEFLSNFGRIPGYPHIFITENNGKVIYSNDIRDMAIKGRLSKEKMLRFLNKWKLKNIQS